MREHDCLRPGCGVRFRHRSGKNANKYCSRSCAFADRDAWNKSHLHPRGPTVERTCRTCGDVYLRALSLAKYRNVYCSEPCQDVALLGRTCSVCGKGFDSEYLDEEACSDPCKRQRERQKERGREAERSGGRTKRRYKRRRRTQRACLTCGHQFLGGNSQRYCSIRCRPRAGRSSTGRHVAYLIERDGGRCKLCGRKVNAKAKAPHPRSAVVDHIVPSSKGGGNERGNLQLAHWSCNSKKAATGCGSQLLLLG